MSVLLLLLAAAAVLAGSLALMLAVGSRLEAAANRLGDADARSAAWCVVPRCS